MRSKEHPCRHLRIVALLLLLTAVLFVCHTAEPLRASDSDDAANEERLAQLAGKRIGILTGTAFDYLASQIIQDPELMYFNSISDQGVALQSGKIDAFLYDEPGVRYIMDQIPGLDYFPVPRMKYHYAMVTSLDNTALQQELNQALAALKAAGTLEELEARWLGTDESVKELPQLEFTGEKGVLRWANASDIPPFAYTKNGKMAGFEIDLLMRICAELGYVPEIAVVDFSAVIPGVVSGRFDVGINSITVTEERSQSVLFTDPYYDYSTMVVVLADEAETAAGGWWAGVVKSFNRTFVEEARYQLILRGLKITLLISLLTALFGSMLGFGICMMRRSPRKWLNVPAKVYIRLVQGIPILVILMILFYIIFTDPDTSGVMVAVIAFSINFAAYVSEMIRTGIEAVDKGQQEAAAALGYNKLQVFTKITFPQAARHFLPVYKGEFISTVKMTSVVGYIAIMDLTKMSDIIRSRTYEPFFPLISIAVIYFLLSYALVSLLTMVEFKLDPRNRERKVKGVTPQ